LDANFFKNKLTINFDYFIRLTNDMLAQVPVPGISGIQDAPYVNAGKVSNKGFEFNINYQEKAGDFKYRVGVNLGSVKNEVIQLGNDQPINSASFRTSFISRTQAGMQLHVFGDSRQMVYIRRRKKLTC
jgi:outer membrane receptor protein involved in Fe transport